MDIGLALPSVSMTSKEGPRTWPGHPYFLSRTARLPEASGQYPRCRFPLMSKGTWRWNQAALPNSSASAPVSLDGIWPRYNSGIFCGNRVTHRSSWDMSPTARMAQLHDARHHFESLYKEPNFARPSEKVPSGARLPKDLDLLRGA